MAIRKRRNKWFVDVYLPNGKRYRKMVGTKKQAEEVERRIKNEIAETRWELRGVNGTIKLVDYGREKWSLMAVIDIP